MGLPEWPELWVVGVLLLGHIGVLGSRVKPGLAQAPLQYSLRSLAFSTCPPQAEKEEGTEGALPNLGPLGGQSPAAPGCWMPEGPWPGFSLRPTTGQDSIRLSKKKKKKKIQ